LITISNLVGCNTGISAGFSRLAGTYIGRVLKGAIIVSSFRRLRRAYCLSSTPGSLAQEL
jgi:hypothetical protein